MDWPSETQKQGVHFALSCYIKMKQITKLISPFTNVKKFGCNFGFGEKYDVILDKQTSWILYLDLNVIYLELMSFTIKK